jgi:hypothetical protein
MDLTFYYERMCFVCHNKQTFSLLNTVYLMQFRKSLIKDPHLSVCDPVSLGN